VKVYVCYDHDGFWMGGVSVVLAENEDDARQQLDAALVAACLAPHKDHPYDLHELDSTQPQACILFNGDY